MRTDEDHTIYQLEDVSISVATFSSVAMGYSISQDIAGRIESLAHDARRVFDVFTT